MIRDTSSNSLISVVVPANAALGVGAVNGTEVDHSLANSATFYINVSDVGVGGTVDGKIQYSDDGVGWTDDDGASGNNVSFPQITAAGNGQLDVFNPRGRYSRAVYTIGVNSVVGCAMAIQNPLRSIEPTDA